MIYLIIIGIALILSGMSEGAMDWLQFRLTIKPNHKWHNNKFLNPDISFNNKWKNGDKSQGEKFFLSSTIGVFLTDGWHLLKWCRNRFINISGIMGLCYLGIVWYWAILIVTASETIYHLGFYITYKK